MRTDSVYKIMKSSLYLVLTAVIILLFTLCSQQTAEITFEQVDAHIRYLSSDALNGRSALSEDIGIAEDYIAEQFEEAGLREFDQFPGYRHEFKYTRRTRRDPEAQPEEYTLSNIIGYIEGSDPVLKDEFILFGAHHDHLGIRGDADDNIYNGAEDNATGTTAVISLAQYFAKAGGNRRSIIFVTFTGEEIGMVGSRQLVEDLPVAQDKLVAVINFEMIGKTNDAGKTECFLTGWDRSDLGTIMSESLGENSLILNEGPVAANRLYFSSDNAPFARAGIVAHTLAGIKSADDEFYHKPNDHYETLDIESMTAVIKGVVEAARTLLSGEATPKNAGEIK